MIAESLLYLVMAAAWLGETAFHFSTQIAGSGDGEFYLWQGWRLGSLIRQGALFPLRIPDVVWPYGTDLRLSDGYLPSYIGGLWNLVAAPIPAYNLTLVTAMVTNAWAARHLATVVSRRRAVWILCALAYATAPGLMLRVNGHLTLLFGFSAPLLLAEALRSVRDGRVRWFRLGLLLFLAYLCSIYYLLFGAIAILIIVAGARSGTQRPAARVAALAGAFALTAILLIPFAIPRLQLDRAEQAHGAPPEAKIQAYDYSADALAVVNPPPFTPLRTPTLFGLYANPPQGNYLEATIFPGFALIAGLGAFLCLRSRLRAPLAIGGLAIWILALGPGLFFAGRLITVDNRGRPMGILPYDLLLDLPGLNSLRTPNRAGWTLAAILVVMLAVSLDWALGATAARWRPALVAAVLGLLASSYVPPATTSDFGVTPAMQAALTGLSRHSQPGDSLVQAPADCDSRNEASIKLQFFHRLPVIGCQASSATVAWYSNFDLYARAAGLAGLRCHPGYVGLRPTEFSATPALTSAGVAETRRALGLRYVLVSAAGLSPGACDGVIRNIGFLRRHATTVAADSGYTLFDLGASRNS